MLAAQRVAGDGGGDLEQEQWAELRLEDQIIRRRKADPRDASWSSSACCTASASTVFLGSKSADPGVRVCLEWAPKSHGFKTRFPKRRALPAGSMALECARNANVHDEARAIAANVWFDTKERVEIVEHSAPVSEAGGVITLLWVPDSVADYLWPRAS